MPQTKENIMTNASKPSAQEKPGKIKEIETTPESELSDAALDQVSGGLKATSRSARAVKVSGPGTQTEDDIYVG